MPILFNVTFEKRWEQTVRDREPLKVRDCAVLFAWLAFTLVLVLTTGAGWNPLVGFVAAVATAGGVGSVLERL